MKDESQQQVPPGIVAFKDTGGFIWKTQISEMPYAKWVRWHLSLNSAIHTISVDEIEYSIDDEVISTSSQKNTYKILSFKWHVIGKWMVKVPMKGAESHIFLDLVGKLPPASQLDRSVSQPGKEGGAWSKEQLSNMLEDVVNVLDLSESMIEKHGPLGTAPAELVREVLKQKDLTIRLLKAGFKHIEPQPSQLGEGKEDQNRMIIERMLFPQPPLPEQGKEEALRKALTEIATIYRNTNLECDLATTLWEIHTIAAAALKSKPTDGWSDEDMWKLYCDVKTNPNGIDFKTWLSSYKQPNQ